MLTASRGWADVRNHCRLRVTGERVFEHLSKLTSTEWRVLFVKVQCANALLQSEERLVNLCTVQLGLLIGLHAIGTTLATCKVDEADLGV